MTDDIRLEEIRVDTRFDTASPTKDFYQLKKEKQYYL